MQPNAKVSKAQGSRLLRKRSEMALRPAEQTFIQPVCAALQRMTATSPL
jgi:hypothetical protein